jgi:hypothetical protein
MNDVDHQAIFRYEASGYPSTPEGVTPEGWRLAGLAERQYVEKKDDKEQTFAYCQSIEELEEMLALSKQRLDVARDPNISISSSNTSQFVRAPPGNMAERNAMHASVANTSKRLAQRRAFLHGYISRVHYELRFSQVASDIFSRLRERSDMALGALAPTAVQKFSAVYDNLVSENPEDWCNAVHSCRRVLQDLADVLFPAQEQSRVTGQGKARREIKLGADNYINRLACFALDAGTSDTTAQLVGSHLHFLGDRLDAVFAAAQKGSHSVVTRDDADRFVVYTYLLAGDLLRLRKQ